MDESRVCDDIAGEVRKPPEEDIASGAGGEGERNVAEEEPTAAQPPRGGAGVSVDDDDSAVADEILAQPPFLNPTGLDSVVEDDAAGASTVVLDVADFAILTPAAAAILRSSFSSRFRSFSLRLSCSSGVFCLARWVFCMSRKRIL
jgi:hypothetical protein